jgi:hypothetical protein
MAYRCLVREVIIYLMFCNLHNFEVNIAMWTVLVGCISCAQAEHVLPSIANLVAMIYCGNKWKLLFTEKPGIYIELLISM